MSLIKFIFLVFAYIAMSGCSEETPRTQTLPSTTQSTTPESAEQITGTVQKSSADWSVGGVTVTLMPDKPTAAGCLSIVIQGSPGRSAIVWKVNGEIVDSGTSSKLCSDFYKRGDLITVEVGTTDQGAQSSVTIANSPPKVVNISSTPETIYAGVDVSVTPIAEDIDGDDVNFSYKWLINGEENPLLTNPVLPGSAFTKGDTIQVQVVPNDFYVDGPTYESYLHTVQNAPPQITSQPPEGISSLEYSYQVVSSDPDDTTFTYRLEEAPEGMTIDADTGLIKWSLTGVAPGEYTIAILVSDPDGAETAQEYRLTLGAPQ